MKASTTRNILLILLGFLSAGAVSGGILLIASPDGALLGISVSEFNNMPFTNYLIPGFILVTLLGLAPALLAIALLKKTKCTFAERFNIFRDMHWSWSYTIYTAFILIGWIHIQLIFLQGPVHWLHTFYAFYALLIIIIALLPKMRLLYKKSKSPEP